ncbi:MAG: TraR/DksA C4-type zinc finger protein [Bacteriovoracaceae bacterium]
MLDYAKFNKLLLNEQEKIIYRIDQLNVDKIRKDEPLDPNLEEQSLSLENIEVVDSLDEISRNKLKQIREALKLIETGKYGVCASCEQLISESRLMAIPYAQICVNCADMLN